jgi:hypothetical protein
MSTKPSSLLARRSPKVQAALREAKCQGLAYVIIDGTLIPIDRLVADRPFCSGKHKMRGMNLHVIASPDGTILSVSRQHTRHRRRQDLASSPHCATLA